MPGAKRTKKSVSYTEHNNDDDDDFVTKVDNTKRTRDMTTNERRIEAKSSARQAPRKRDEKLSKSEQEQLELALQLSKETVSTNEVSIEPSTTADDKENSTSQSTVSSNESQTMVENGSDEQNENSLPKSKRMKREEEEEEEEEEDEPSSEEEQEEEEEDLPSRKKPIRQTETKKHSEIPTVTNIDLNSTRSITRGQQKSSIPPSEPPKKKSNVPVGFPTSKIVIPSLQTSRVGLSRKSSAIKSLHPTLNQRVVHE